MTNVSTLRLRWNDPALSNILTSKPNLKVLQLDGTVTTTMEESKAIQLKTHTSNLVEVLKNQKSFFYVDGTSLYLILKNMLHLEVLDMRQCTGQTDLPTDAKPLSVKDFRIDDTDRGHMAYAGLLVLFPGLQEFRTCFDRGDYDVADMIGILKSSCKNLRALHLDSFHNPVWIAQMILHSPGSILEFHIAVQRVIPAITYALTSRAKSAVTITIATCQECYSDLGEYLEILTECHQLRTFRAQTHILAESVGEILFQEPWSCMQLRTIEFQGPRDHDERLVEEIPSPWILSYANERFMDQKVWTKNYSEEACKKRQVLKFHARLLKHIEPMKKLQEVIVNDSRYTRTASY
ncbi:hypothetical protein BGZ51_000728 [Haplosporangium sp. Z 767]|nr:hypothetical protein BGZ51_000728 [Haplosporangium sp. Z 767]